VHALPHAAPLWAVAAVVGGFLGSELGARQFAEVTLRRLLAIVLAMAGLKLILSCRWKSTKGLILPTLLHTLSWIRKGSIPALPCGRFPAMVQREMTLIR